MRLRLRVAELPAPRLCGGEGGFRSFGNQTRLVLGDRSENVNSEPVCKRHIGRNEIDVAFQKPRDHRDAASQSVETGNDQLRVIDTAKPKRLFELWSILRPTAFDLGHFGEKASGVFLDIAVHRVLLREQA